MKYRKLRIAWSVGWGVVAGYLVVLTAHAMELKPLSKNPSIMFGKPPLEWIEYYEDEGLLSVSSKLLAFDVGIGQFILPAVALAAIPWLPTRFSLRTLLIATTLIAVMLGIIVWLSRAG